MKTVNNTIEDKIRRYSYVTCLIVCLILFLITYKCNRDKMDYSRDAITTDEIQLQEMIDYHRSQGREIIVF